MFDKQFRVMVVSDMDWTMVDHDDHGDGALKEFNDLWNSKFKHDSALVFSTGRSLQLFQELASQHPLGTPDLLVCSVGSEIYRFDEARNPSLDPEWIAHLDEGWDREKACAIAREFSELKPQRDSEQRPHKISFHLECPREEGRAKTSALQARLRDAGLPAKVIYSGGLDVDILPDRAGKGQALAWLLEKMGQDQGKPSQGTVVCGDSGNDVELFEVDGVFGCMVSNAHEELRHFCEREQGGRKIHMCQRRCAGGIVETLYQFGLVPQ
ncbi:unnamed protein product [Pedinophyceae sp. YPF-701]|nr:unnamed protein product [Pedinophyceae sp. YPF-701]